MPIGSFRPLPANPNSTFPFSALNEYKKESGLGTDRNMSGHGLMAGQVPAPQSPLFRIMQQVLLVPGHVFPF